MKKGRHRRYEEARALKQTSDNFDSTLNGAEIECVECGSLPGDHKTWCGLKEDVPTGSTSQDLFPS